MNRAPGRADNSTERRRGHYLWPLAVFFGFLGIAVGVSLLQLPASQPITFDAGNYEFYTGYALLHGWGSPISLAGQLESYLDAQMNVLYYLLISNLSARSVVDAIASLQALPVVVLSYLTWLVAWRATGRRLLALPFGLLAGAGALWAPLHLITLGETSSDVLLGVLPVLAVALLFPIVDVSSQLVAAVVGGGELESKLGRGLLLRAALAGALIGAATALKMTEVAFSAAIVIAFVVALLAARSRRGWSLRQCAGLVTALVVPAAIVAVLVYLPEALMLWHEYHDPFWPFFNGFFHSPWLLPQSFNPGPTASTTYAARTPLAAWDHFVQLFIGGRGANGIFSMPVSSPVLFFALVAVAVALVVDLVRRDRPQALLLELAFLIGFVLWDVGFGFYRYLAPIEISAVAVVIVLLLLAPAVASQGRRWMPRLGLGGRQFSLRQPLSAMALVAVLAAGVGVGSADSTTRALGLAVAYRSNYFAVDEQDFATIGAGAGVVLVAGAADAFVVPYLPPGTLVVRSGGNLDQVVSKAWWPHVASVVRHSDRRWWVIIPAGVTKARAGHLLRMVGLTSQFGSCYLVPTDWIRLRVCPIVAPTGGQGLPLPPAAALLSPR